MKAGGYTPSPPTGSILHLFFNGIHMYQIGFFANNKIDNIGVIDDYVVKIILSYYTTLMSFVKPAEYSQDCVCSML
jgi:hypothetical protein